LMIILKSQKGISFIVALLIMGLMSVLGFGVASLVATDSRVSVNQLRSTQAFWLAEAGIERANRWLRFQDPPPGGTSPFTLYDELPLGAGTFTVIVDPDDGNPTTYLKRYTITSIGRVGNISRRIRARFRMTTFGHYAYLTRSEGGIIWFYTGDVIEGPLHSNDQISIWGSPVFLGKVTSSATSFRQGYEYDPDFREGYQLGVPPIYMPSWDEVKNTYWIETGSSPELIINAQNGREAGIVFNPDGTLTYSVWHWEDSSKIYDIPSTVVNLADLNGLVYVEGSGKVEVSGTVNGAITIMAEGNIFIVDDVVYLAADSTGRPQEGCDDWLGLISKKNVIIADNQANREGGGVKINAAILALEHSFTVENYWSGSFRGYLTVWGSISQDTRGPVGTFGWYGMTGYLKDYHYDTRFLDQPPPYFPVTGEYDTYTWEEIE